MVSNYLFLSEFAHSCMLLMQWNLRETLKHYDNKGKQRVIVFFPVNKKTADSMSLHEVGKLPLGVSHKQGFEK